MPPSRAEARWASARTATRRCRAPSATGSTTCCRWRSARQPAEWSADEVYLSLPRPGGDAWLSIDRASGAVEYERTDRGWIAYLNDLHKGRNTGAAWRWFIDIFALACLVFCITGLFLLQTACAPARASTWPLVGAGPGACRCCWRCSSSTDFIDSTTRR